MPEEPIPYKMLIDKGKKGKEIAKIGETVWVYNTDHGEVYLAKNKSGETFSIRKEHLEKI